MPNIAIIEQLHSENPDIKFSYIGSKSGQEKKLLINSPVQYFSVSTGKYRRYFDLRNITDLFRIPFGFLQSFFIIQKIKPDILFSLGGFVALPVVFAAFFSRIPIIIHESDSIPGLTTRLTSKVALQIWGESQNLQKLFPKKFKLVKLPIRKFLSTGSKAKFQSQYNFNNNTKSNLLIIGGSQGATAINQFIFDNLPALTDHLNIFHICGPNKTNSIKHKDYAQVDYLQETLADAYAWSDIILTRAGATAISEITSLAKKAILVPLPTTQSRGEQLQNAENLAIHYPALVIQQDDLSVEKLLSATKKLQETKPPTDLHNKNQFSSNLFSEILA